MFGEKEQRQWWIVGLQSLGTNYLFSDRCAHWQPLQLCVPTLFLRRVTRSLLRGIFAAFYTCKLEVTQKRREQAVLIVSHWPAKQFLLARGYPLKVVESVNQFEQIGIARRHFLSQLVIKTGKIVSFTTGKAFNSVFLIIFFETAIGLATGHFPSYMLARVGKSERASACYIGFCSTPITVLEAFIFASDKKSCI